MRKVNLYFFFYVVTELVMKIVNLIPLPIDYILELGEVQELTANQHLASGRLKKLGMEKINNNIV